MQKTFSIELKKIRLQYEHENYCNKLLQKNDMGNENMRGSNVQNTDDPLPPKPQDRKNENELGQRRHKQYEFMVC